MEEKQQIFAKPETNDQLKKLFLGHALFFSEEPNYVFTWNGRPLPPYLIQSEMVPTIQMLQLLFLKVPKDLLVQNEEDPIDDLKSSCFVRDSDSLSQKEIKKEFSDLIGFFMSIFTETFPKMNLTVDCFRCIFSYMNQSDADPSMADYFLFCQRHIQGLLSSYLRDHILSIQLDHVYTLIRLQKESLEADRKMNFAMLKDVFLETDSENKLKKCAIDYAPKEKENDCDGKKKIPDSEYIESDKASLIKRNRFSSNALNPNFLMMNPHFMLHASFQSLLPVVRKNWVMELENNLFFRTPNLYLSLRRRVHCRYRIGKKMDHKSFYIYPDVLYWRELFGYECILFYRKMWPLLQYEFPERRRYFITIVTKNVPFVDRMRPILSEEKDEGKISFCCYLDDPSTCSK